MSTENQFFKFEEKFQFNSPVYHVKIAEGTVIAVTKNILIRFNLKNPSHFEEIKITPEDDLAHNIFIDPTGNHIIVCMQSSQSYYLSKSSNKFRYIKEAKNILIEAVGWNIGQATENTTQSFLVGTSTGEIFETKLTNNTMQLEQYWTRIIELEQTVTGIIFDSYPAPNSSNYFLIVTTKTSIYPFFVKDPNAVKGGQIFYSHFAQLNHQTGGLKCTTFPFDFGYSELDMFYNIKKQFPKYISWMNGAGIYWAKINPKIGEAEGNIFLKPKLLPYSTSKAQRSPINISNTKFHIILQYDDVIDVFCVIQDEHVYSVNSKTLGNDQFLGLCKDFSNGFIYLFTHFRLFRLNYDNETINLWPTFVKSNNYKKAYKYCNNEAENLKIKLKEADRAFSEEKFNDAGKLYAHTSMSFEAVTLKFIDLENKAGLKSFLLEYAKEYKSGTVAGQNSYDIVCMWLLELYFEEINAEHFKTGKDITSLSFQASNEEYQKFVQCPKIIESLKRNKNLIYEKIKNYGDNYQSAIFSEIIEDKVKLIECHLEKGNFEDAIKMLKTEKSPKPHYMFGSVIIAKYPNELVNIWIRLSDRLDPRKTLPILRTTTDEIAFKYVKHLITSEMNNKNYQKPVLEELHNFFILLCAKLAKTTDKTMYTNEIMTYLKKQGINHLQTSYDPQLALRICVEWNNVEGSVFLHCLLQKHKEAVELSLKEKNLELAQEVAVKYTGPEEIRKNLWLQIARFIIDENKNIEEVCRLVNSKSRLKLEDVLPFFPDSVKIEEFSGAICDSLKYYNEHNDNLKKDMKLATDYALKTREEIKFLKQRPISVARDTRCAYCHQLLTLTSFCLFPCRHVFHMHCLEKVATPMLLYQGSELFLEILDKASSNNVEDTSLRSELNKLLTKDCSFCGTVSIDIIDKPIISYTEFENEMKKWE